MFLGEAVWAESGDSAALHRATSELFALAVQIGSDTFAAFLITQVMKHLAETPSPQKCAIKTACIGAQHQVSCPQCCHAISSAEIQCCAHSRC